MADTTSTLAHGHSIGPDMSAGAAVAAGALFGALGGFLFLTARGTEVRHRLLDTSSRLLDGLDAALTGWVQLSGHAEAWRRPDAMNGSATRAATPTAGGSER